MASDISKAAIKRLSLVAGVSRLNNQSYDAILSLLYGLTSEIVNKSIIFAEHSGRQTLFYDDLVEAVRLRGDNLYGSKDTVYKICKSPEGLAKNTSDCVFIAKAQFKKVVKRDTGELRISPGFLENLQYYVERKVIGVVSMANDVTRKIGGRVTLQPKDIGIMSHYDCKGGDLVGAPVKRKKKRSTKRKSPRSK